MKKKELFFLYMLLSCFMAFGQGPAEYITIERDYDTERFSAPDSLGIISVLKMPDEERAGELKLPYPIIFIHGLNSSSETWDVSTNWMDVQYGLTYGGRFDACLNYDANHFSANTDLYPTIGADIGLFSPTLIKGDYYYMNYDVGYNGSVFPNTGTPDYCTSDQSAIVKQATALGWAISEVLQITGRDKVVLMGHSMGGLASREYLQNSKYWQADGKTHVAKLVTTGTPHGGSNSSSFGTGIGGADEQSEAVRDLRRTYYYSGDNGVFLFGGLELQDNSSHMDDNINLSGYDFHNVDVNCNGVEGDNIVGLNAKNIYTNVEYSCIIGDCSGCILGSSASDGIVNVSDANLNNFYTIDADVYLYNASALTEIHTDLPEQSYQNMQGLDAPNEYNNPYEIEFNTNYYECITEQPTNGYLFDFDNFKFTKTTHGEVTITISDIYLSDLRARLLDSSNNLIGQDRLSNGNSSFSFTQNLPAGEFKLEVYAEPTMMTYLAPYKLYLEQSGVGIEDGIPADKELELTIYPNPALSMITLSFSHQQENTVVAIYDIVGTIVKTANVFGVEKILQIDDLESGLYLVRVETENGIVVNKKIIVQ